LVDFSFENIFDEKYDFFATIFEYLIKDYNKDGGGKYAEYYTPHAVAKIMADILVTESVRNVSCYDPSAGSGTLLMSLAHAIGEDRCSIYSQDISQKSSSLLRLNLILNNLVHSISNIVQGNTIKDPYHKGATDQLEKFDFIVSNPPFNLDFSDWRDDIDSKTNNDRFFAGIPKVPPKKKDSMAIYTLFIQHIIYSLNKNGKAAIVVPTSFVTKSGIPKLIREHIIEEEILEGVVSMPSNIFANTPTSVSIIFLNKSAKKIVLIDASKLGSIIKENGNQKTILSTQEETNIITTFNSKQSVSDFSVALEPSSIRNKNYSFSAGQYFDVKIEYSKVSPDDFKKKLNSLLSDLENSESKSATLKKNIIINLKNISYDSPEQT